MTGGNSHPTFSGPIVWPVSVTTQAFPRSQVGGNRMWLPFDGVTLGTADQTRARVARACVRSDRRDLVRLSSRTMITRRRVALAAVTLCLLAAAGGAAAYEFQYGDYQPCATEDAECSCDGMARWGFEMEENVGTKWVSIRHISRRRRGAWFSSFARAARISEHP